MEPNDTVQTELTTLRDLAGETEYDTTHAATKPQLGRISEVFRRAYGGVKLPRLIRIRAIADLLGYNYRHFRTSEQLSIKGAGAIITWAFVQHGEGADLDTVPLRDPASETIRWAIEAASDKTTLEELATDEERHKAERRKRSKERYARKKREAAPLSHQV